MAGHGEAGCQLPQALSGSISQLKYKIILNLFSIFGSYNNEYALWYLGIVGRIPCSRYRFIRT